MSEELFIIRHGNWLIFYISLEYNQGVEETRNWG